MEDVAAGVRRGIADARSQLQKELDLSIEQVGRLRGTLDVIAREVQYSRNYSGILRKTWMPLSGLVSTPMDSISSTGWR